MHMNHVNLCVTDVPRSRAFFERYFGYRLLVEKGADKFVGLVDDGGMILAISNFNHAEKVDYPPLFHVGFFLDTDEEVNKVHERLAADGFDPGKPKHFQGPGPSTSRRRAAAPSKWPTRIPASSDGRTFEIDA